MDEHLIKYRLLIGIAMLGLAILSIIKPVSGPHFILYFIAVVLILGHFLFGPMRLIQSAMEEGDMEGAKNRGLHKFSGFADQTRSLCLLYPPGNLAMMSNDYDAAEKHMKRGLELGGGSLTKQAEGPNKLQLGMLSLQKRRL